MTGSNRTRLRTLLEGYERRTRAQPAPAPAEDRPRLVCAEVLRSIVGPVLDSVMADLRNAGHEAATRDDTDHDNAYPSVALSFTPRSPGVGAALASALIFRYDPRHGIVVQSDVKPTPAGKRVATTADRQGTIGVDAVTPAWVETKTVNFVEAVLKAN